jgi:peptidyl-dipeptidase Dcp
MLAQDSFAWFQQHGGLTRENGQRFLDMILSRGNTLDYADMYRAWAGHDPEIQPYLDFYGLAGGAAAPAAPTAAPPPPPAAAPAETPRPGERGR